MSDWVPSPFPCRHCRVGVVRTRIWQSSSDGCERVYYHCGDCYRSWYINGTLEPGED